jgi:hypothetical protein
MIPVIFNRFSLRTEKIISKILHKMTVSNKCLFTLSGKRNFTSNILRVCTERRQMRSEDKVLDHPTKDNTRLNYQMKEW